MEPTLAQIDGYLRLHGTNTIPRLPMLTRKYVHTGQTSSLSVEIFRVAEYFAPWVGVDAVMPVKYSVSIYEYNIYGTKKLYSFVMTDNHDLAMLAAVLDMDEWGSLWEPLSKQLRSK